VLLILVITVSSSLLTSLVDWRLIFIFRFSVPNKTKTDEIGRPTTQPRKRNRQQRRMRGGAAGGAPHPGSSGSGMGGNDDPLKSFTFSSESLSADNASGQTDYGARGYSQDATHGVSDAAGRGGGRGGFARGGRGGSRGGGRGGARGGLGGMGALSKGHTNGNGTMGQLSSSRVSLYGSNSGRQQWKQRHKTGHSQKRQRK
jgi:hypothetical protein